MGKRANMPVYKLLGGKVRAAVPLYTHASARELPELEDQVRKCNGRRDTGTCACNWPSLASRATACQSDCRDSAEGAAAGRRAVAGVRADALRQQHDQDVRLSAVEDRLRCGTDARRTRTGAADAGAGAGQSGGAVTGFSFWRMCWRPRMWHWFQRCASRASTPLAMGELFVNRNEWLPLVANRWIDFIRCHISAIGGLSLARKIAATCEMFGVRTAWHGPANVSPVGHAVNLHLDLTCYNFGIQEQNMFSEKLSAKFSRRAGDLGRLLYANDRPGWGIDIDEKAAAKYPYKGAEESRGNDRRLDGTHRAAVRAVLPAARIRAPDRLGFCFGSSN